MLFKSCIDELLMGAYLQYQKTKTVNIIFVHFEGGIAWVR